MSIDSMVGSLLHCVMFAFRYMTFVQALTGGGGWPLTVFLTPELIPFFGGTYFPPEDVGGQMGFPDLLHAIAAKWKTHGSDLAQSGQRMMEEIKDASKRTSGTESSEEVKTQLETAVERTLDHLERSYDKIYGGFGGAPKFPTPPLLSFLLRAASPDCKYYEIGRADRASGMAVETLIRMAQGGLHDHLEGGFHRYSVDRQWHLPHFEKMLYDQGQLMAVYSTAYALRQEPLFKSAVLGIFDYVTKHLQAPEGAFYCAEDADSVPASEPESGEKREGAFAVWSQEQIDKLLPVPLRSLFCAHYGIKPEGNIDPSRDPHGEMAGLNVLDALNATHEDRHALGKPQLEIEEALAEAQHILAEHRSKRPRPSRDDKILASWNGLMITGLCRAYRVFGLSDRYKTEAVRATEFINKNMIKADTGHLLHVHKPAGQQQIEAFSDDYALFIQALLDVYEITLDNHYLEQAKKLQDHMNSEFWQPEAGAFAGASKVSGDGIALPLVLFDDYDGAEPSSNSVAAMNLARLFLLTGNPSYTKQQETLLSSFITRINQAPFSMPALLDAFLFNRAPPMLAVIEAPSMEAAEELHLTALSTYHHCITFKGNIDESIKSAAAHVCYKNECSAPVSDCEAFTKLLRASDRKR